MPSSICFHERDSLGVIGELAGGPVGGAVGSAIGDVLGSTLGKHLGKSFGKIAAVIVNKAIENLRAEPSNFCRNSSNM